MSGERALTVDHLRELLADLPGYYPVAIQTIVGGDLVTDDVDLVDIKVTGGSNDWSPHVVLVPDPADPYCTRDLIDEALAARATP